MKSILVSSSLAAALLVTAGCGAKAPASTGRIVPLTVQVAIMPGRLVRTQDLQPYTAKNINHIVISLDRIESSGIVPVDNAQGAPVEADLIPADASDSIQLGSLVVGDRYRVLCRAYDAGGTAASSLISDDTRSSLDIDAADEDSAVHAALILKLADQVVQASVVSDGVEVDPGTLIVPVVGGSLSGFAVSTLAGSTPGFADGATDSAQFNDPLAIAADASGDLFVADSGNDRIREIAHAGDVTTLAGSSYGSLDGPVASARFADPTGIALDASGDILVADTGNNRIRMIANGQVSTLAGGAAGYADGSGSAAEFQNPAGMAVGPGRTLYVADTGNDCIREVSPSGQVTTLAGEPGKPGLADGSPSQTQFNGPMALAYDPVHQILYVADTGNHSIREIRADGTVSTLAGSGAFGDSDGTGSAATFDGPSGIAVDAAGNVFVADTNNNTIREIAPSGLVRTIAGSGYEGNADEIGLAAEFSAPAGLAIGEGGVLVCDSGNGRIRLVRAMTSTAQK